MDEYKPIVNVVTATKDITGRDTGDVFSRRRVAAYARVSTDSDEQETSFEHQSTFYEQYIRSNPLWKFVGLYADEGISGTMVKGREGFKRMIADAKDGKIDLIVTKSISRFARNTVDSLVTVRELKDKGIEVFFEKENIYTMDSKGELLITVMSSIAQEESRNISENVTWGNRKRMQEGRVTMPYDRFLGYERGEDGKPKIVESEAAVVRRIYKEYLGGKSASTIAKELMAENIASPSGGKKWYAGTIESILRNEKYKGEAILQKTYTVSYLTKEKRVNTGELPQYHVEKSHPPIVSAELHAIVQEEYSRRKSKGYQINLSCFSGKFICSECGGVFGSKLWHSNDQYRKTVWRCNNKYRTGHTKCATPHVDEKQMKQAFVEAMNTVILYRKTARIEANAEMLRELSDNAALEAERDRLIGERDTIEKRIRQYIAEQSKMENGVEIFDAWCREFDEVKKKIEANQEAMLIRAAKSEVLADFLKALRKTKGMLTDFDEELWNALVEKVTVTKPSKRSDGLVFLFKNGEEVRV